MKDPELRFTGSVPEKYERLMVPLIFRPYAEELARRAQRVATSSNPRDRGGNRSSDRALHASPARCGNRRERPQSANARRERGAHRIGPCAVRARPMLSSFRSTTAASTSSYASSARCSSPTGCAAIQKRGACFATAAIICSRSGTGSSAMRLATPTQQVLIDAFPDDPPLFMREGPFGYSDPLRIETDLHDAGFETVEIETVELRSRSPSAHDAATALCYGTPMGIELDEREPGQPRARFPTGRASAAAVRRPRRHRRADVGAHRDCD